MTSQVTTYINRSILINSLPKDAAATRVLPASSDEDLLSFYSNTYETVDVAHFLLPERKERLFGLINLIRDGEYFLDVGCANGAHMDELYKRGIYGIGLDVSVPNILKGLEQRPHLKFIHGFAENIPFENAHFDVAIIGDVLERFRDPKLAIAEILRVTKTGFAVCFPNSSEKTIEHIHPVTVSSFMELCAFYALEVVFFDKDGQMLPEADESFLWCFARTQKSAKTDMIVQSVASESKKHFDDKERVLGIDQWKWGETHHRDQTETDRFSVTSIAIKGKNVLEVACGNGDLSVFLAKLGFCVTGIDISNTGIHQATSYAEKENVVGRTRFLVMDATKLNFPDNTFDSVLLPEVMEHVTSSRQYINEAIRVLKPGGRIVVSVPDTLEIPWPGHIRLFTKETLGTELEQYADDIVWYDMTYKKWLLCAFTPRVKQGSEVVDDLPLVNILMPTYNRSHLIRRAINSIARQTYANWKLLVLNDGGEDISDIVNSFRDERIHYYRFEHAGKAAALNHGLRLIDSEYIAYLDDDDIVFPSHLESLVRTALLNNKAFVYSDTYLTSVDADSGKVLDQVIENTADVDSISLKFFNQINHKQILHTKGLSDTVGLYDESLEISIDYDYIKRLALTEPPYHVKLITGNHFLYYRNGEINTITGLWDRNPKTCGESLINIFKKHPQDMCELYRGFHHHQSIATEQDGRITTLTQTLSEREGQVVDLNQALIERDIQINTLTQTLAERDGQIAALHRSTSWLITRPLRVVGHQLKRFRRVLDLAIPAMRRGGGLKNTLEKAMHLYRHEGLAGIKRGFRIVATSDFDRNGYAEWFRHYDMPTSKSLAKMKDCIDNLVHKPLISVVMPAYNTKPEWLNEAIESVRKQIYPYWELCIADGGSGQETTDCLSQWQKLDERIKVILLEENKGIAGNSIEAFALAQGDYIVLLDHDDYLSSDALMEVALCINKNTEVDFIYSDKAVFSDETKKVLAYHHLPGFSPDFLRACNYASHLNAFSRHIIDNVGFIKQEYDGSQDYEFELRVIEKARKIVNIPKVLYFSRACQGSVALNPESKLYAYEAGRKAIEEHIKRIGYEGDVEFMSATYSYRIHYKIKGAPLVSIIIPNKDHKQDLQKCIDSIMIRSTYNNYEIIIAENNSEKEGTFAYYDKLRNVKSIKIIQHNGKDFNFAAINNYAVQFAAGEHILLLNNDTEVITPNWIEEMLAFSQREDVGTVGAKLYYADNRIQHAGLVIGLAGSIASHYHYGNDRSCTGYMHRLVMPQNYCAVTGACLMVKKSLYQQVGGLDEVNFKIGLNDVDFCLKLREIGKINVLTPYAELYHYESLSRGLDTTPEKSARLKAESDYFREKWKSYFKKGDPYQ